MKIKNILVTVMLALSVVTATFANEVKAPDLKGIQLGITLEQFNTKQKEAGANTMAPMDSANGTFIVPYFGTIASVKADIGYTFWKDNENINNSKLWNIVAFVPADEGRKVYEALVAKFGQPVRVTGKFLADRIGGTSMFGVVAEWHMQGRYAVVFQGTGQDITKAQVTIVDMKEAEKYNNSDAKTAASDL